jgi:hypothetical protein
MDHDEILGQFNEAQTVSLAKKASEAQAMLQAAQAQQAQVANAQQMQMNAAMGMPQGGNDIIAQPQQAPTE